MATNVSLTLNDVQNKYNVKEICGVASIEINSKLNSGVWKSFDYLAKCDAEGKVIEHIKGYVICKICKSILSYDSKLSGTSHLKRHEDNHAQKTFNSNGPSINQYLKKEVPQEAKKKVTKSLVEFVVEDLRNFSVVEGTGFIKFANTLIGVGAKYGNVDASDILCHRTTIANNVFELEKKKKRRIKTKIKSNFIIISTSNIINNRYVDRYLYFKIIYWRWMYYG